MSIHSSPAKHPRKPTATPTPLSRTQVPSKTSASASAKKSVCDAIVSNARALTLGTPAVCSLRADASRTLLKSLLGPPPKERRTTTYRRPAFDPTTPGPSMLEVLHQQVRALEKIERVGVEFPTHHALVEASGKTPYGVCQGVTFMWLLGALAGIDNRVAKKQTAFVQNPQHPRRRARWESETLVAQNKQHIRVTDIAPWVEHRRAAFGAQRPADWERWFNPYLNDDVVFLIADANEVVGEHALGLKKDGDGVLLFDINGSIRADSVRSAFEAYNTKLGLDADTVRPLEVDVFGLCDGERGPCERDFVGDPNFLDAQGNSLALRVADRGDLGCLRRLHDVGCDLGQANHDGVTPAFIAAFGNNVGVLTLLKELGCDLSAPDNKGETPAFIAAKSGHVRALAFLKKAGYDVNTPNHEGVTPAFIAAYHGHVDVLKLLNTYGCDLTSPHPKFGTPLFIAGHQKHEEVVTFLRELPQVSARKSDSGCAIQ